MFTVASTVDDEYLMSPAVNVYSGAAFVQCRIRVDSEKILGSMWNIRPIQMKILEYSTCI